MTLRVLLVNPPQEPDIDSNLPRFVDQARGALPPLGLLYVGSSARAQGHEVRIADAAIGNDAVAIAQEFRPDIIGVTATTFTLLSALHIIDALHKTLGPTPDALSCPQITRYALGGVHASVYPQQTLKTGYGVDYAVSGEGEKCFPRLLKDLADGTAPEKAVIEADGFIENLDALPAPDRTMTDWKKYRSAVDRAGLITTIMTSRGCPFNCVFCHRPHMGKRFRARSAYSVVSEIEDIKRLGIDEVTFYDDTFAVDRDRVVRICQEMIKGNYRLRWDIRTRVDLVDPELLRLLKRAGCKQIRYGVEASSERILKEIGKGITLERVEKAVRWTHEAGIETLTYFIIGSPGELPSDWERTIRFSKKLNPDYCYFAIMTPYPATPLYTRWLAETGRPDHWADFACNPREIATPYYQSWIDREVLEETLSRAYKEFYLRPGYLIKRALEIRNLEELRRGLGAVLGMIMKRGNRK